MKRIIIILVLAACMGHVSAQVKKELIQKDIQTIKVGDVNKIFITQGSENMVAIDEMEDVEGEPITMSGSKLTVNTQSSTIRLTLKPGTLRVIEVEDEASAMVEMPFIFGNKVALVAKDVATIRLGDTGEVQCEILAIEGEDYAKVSIASTVKARKAVVNTADEALVRLQRLVADTLAGSMQDVSAVRINDGAVTYSKYMTSDDAVCELNGVKQTSVSQGMMRDATLATDGKISKGRYYSAEERFGFDFGLGWGAWGENWYNSVAGMDGAYDARMAFSGIYFDFTYAIVRMSRVRLDVGLGWDWKKITLKNNYVLLTDPNYGGSNSLRVASSPNEIGVAENLTGSLADPAVWTTQVKTRYLTLPVRFAFNIFEADFEVGLSAIPKINISGKKQGLVHSIDASNMEETRVDARFGDYLIRPLALDARIDMVFNNQIGMYVQTGLTPMTKNLSKNPYNFELGFFIRLCNE